MFFENQLFGEIFQDLWKEYNQCQTCHGTIYANPKQYV